MTPRQLQRMAEAHNRAEKAALRREQLMAYNIAALTVSFFGSGLNGKRVPSFDECFPDGTEGEKMDDAAIIERIVTINRLIGGEIRYETEENSNASS